MIQQTLKVIAAGILAGVAIFLMPFILIRIFLIVVIIRLIFRLLGGRRSKWRHGPQYNHRFHFAFQRKWESMSEEQKIQFRQKMENDFFSKMNNQ